VRIEGRPILDIDLNLTNQGADPIVLQFVPFMVASIDFSALSVLGSLQAGDQLIVCRDDEQHKITAEDMKQFLGLPVKIQDPFNNEHEL